MSRKLSRKAPSARHAAASDAKARQLRAARARTGSLVDSAMALVPLDERQLHRVFLVLILAGALGIAGVVARYAGLPSWLHRQSAHAALAAGFEVKRVEVRGVKHLNELKVYERALAERDRALPLVDIDALRGELMQLSWVEDARVSRQFPDTLVIDVVERKPLAVLRKGDALALIDRTGHELEPITADRIGNRLVLSGQGAGSRIGALSALFAAAPAIKPQVAEAAWVGNRRWNLTFKTGQVLALPEGEHEAAHALMTFARLDGVNRLLGGRAMAFDMRAPDRMYLRIPGRSTQPTTTSSEGSKD